jgi:oxygen-independent coproporphyrinogen-3 oxidase
MSGIYIHIPFCKQACYYCDFHFSTSLKRKGELLHALAKELILRKDEFKSHAVETIYFGGGTPSLLSIYELQLLIDTVYEHYNVVSSPEITLETNPDDLTTQQLNDLTTLPINRLSIGIQSFFDEDLKLMNRAHNAGEAKRCLEEAAKHFRNITIDLIYGIPGLTNVRWIENIETALTFNIPHISSYALTVEPKTALEAFIKKGLFKMWMMLWQKNNFIY